MFFSILLLVAAHVLPTLVHALPTPAPQQITIQVGGNSSSPGGVQQFHSVTQFKPNVVVAAKGTIVRFQFTGVPGNHSVVQSSFANPCQPLAGGFDSGWVSVPEGGLSSPPEWNLTITNDTIPIWFFCKQLFPVPHCHSGMVGVINVDTTNHSFPEFQDNVAAVSAAPSQDQGAFVGVGASATGAPFLPSGALYFNTAAAPAAAAAASSASSASSPSPTPDAGSSTSDAGDPTPDSGPSTSDPTSTLAGPQNSPSAPPSSARSMILNMSMRSWTAAIGLVLGLLVW